jgi:lipoate-protein ligase B
MNALKFIRFNPKSVGHLDYRKVLRLQNAVTEYNALGKIPDGLNRHVAELLKSKSLRNTVLMLEHSPTFTAGRRIPRQASPSSSDNKIYNTRLNATGDVVYIDRGGEWTYHGPGQLVIYPLINLQYLNLTPKQYIQSLQTVMTRTLQNYGIKASASIEELPVGVWINQNKKISAIGVSIKRRWCMHGISVNLDKEVLDWFSLIVPCGLKQEDGFGVTSLESELGHPVDKEQFMLYLLKEMEHVWKVHMEPLDSETSEQILNLVK